MNRKLLVLTEKFAQSVSESKRKSYGGCEFQLPESHKAGISVPNGGACCNNCEYLRIKEDGPHCHNQYWQAWNCQESRLPTDIPLEYCCDWWEEK